MSAKVKILIVEDQFIEANNIRLILRDAGYAVLPMASSVTQALTILQHESADLVLLDISLEGQQTGIDLAKILKGRGLPFVYLSANSDKSTLDMAKETEPYGFLVKPLRKKDVLIMVEVALYLHQQRVLMPEFPIDNVPPPDSVIFPIVGESKGIREVLNNVRVVAPSELSVLILGENGTGKELVAEAIHRLSGRRDKPLVTVNCAVLPADLIESELFGHEKGAFTGAHEKRIGKFEQAEGGSMFLDEIGELPPNLQAKFLRVLQSGEIEPVGGKGRKVSVRIIAATNRVLEDEVAAGRFRIDLYVIKSKPRPLAAYIYSRDQRSIDTFTTSISFGGGCVNQNNLQTFFTGLVPFGGVGTSGLGKYYGKYGFESLTNAKTIIVSPANFSVDGITRPGLCLHRSVLSTQIGQS
jgi:two-component system response regulator HydG